MDISTTLRIVMTAVMLLIAAIAAYTDIRGRYVPNWLVLPAIPVGLALNISASGWDGLISSGLGILICGGVFFAMFVLGGMGAGDVKLMAAIGALAGWPGAVYVLVYTVISGGVIAIGALVVRGRLFGTIKNMFKLSTFREAKKASDDPNSVEAAEIEKNHAFIPYAPAVLVGVVLALLL